MLTIDDILNTDELFQNKHASFEPVTGGNVNKAYKVNCEDKVYFVRINRSQSSFLGTDPVKEAEACRQASRMLIAPAIHNSKNAASTLLLIFLPGNASLKMKRAIRKLSENTSLR